MTAGSEDPQAPVLGAAAVGEPENATRQALSRGELTVIGRIRSASNATFLCEVQRAGRTVHCVYKPIAGEQPLWDFPDGTLAGRELGAYLVSAALGWDIVPFTVLRDGPAGPGMVQRWIEQPTDSGEGDAGDTRDLVELFPVGDVPPGYLPVLRAHDYAVGEVVLVHADNPWLRRMAVFDILINNADRKGGHVLTGLGDGVYGVDHGICLHVEDKLRTVLWGWAGKPIDEETLAAVAGLEERLHAALAEELRVHITGAEVAALRRRAQDLLQNAVMPGPDRHRPIPWPAF